MALKSSGKLRWFNATKGYGFIQLDGESKDVFLHKSVLRKCGIATDPQEGQAFTFDLETKEDGRLKAANVALA